VFTRGEEESFTSHTWRHARDVAMGDSEGDRDAGVPSTSTAELRSAVCSRRRVKTVRRRRPPDQLAVACAVYESARTAYCVRRVAAREAFLRFGKRGDGPEVLRLVSC